jgi:hypothetical protein
MKRSNKALWMVCLLGLAAVLSACSSIPLKERTTAERARLEAYAGVPLRHIAWYGRFDGWKPVSQDEALLWTTPRRAYLVKVAQPCEDLRFARRIGITSTLSSFTVRDHDHLKVRGEYCRIERIRPIDYERLRADLRRERESRQAVIRVPATQPNAGGADG